MSVKASWFQIGLSGTANLNFHWRNLLDGVLRLTRGNAGAPIADVMLVKADNSVEFPGGVSGGVLGAGQTWQNVTGSRAVGTTYTNSTGKPIMVYVAMSQSSNTVSTLTIGGVALGGTYLGNNINGFSSPLIGVVPNGATYAASGGTISTWAELR